MPFCVLLLARQRRLDRTRVEFFWARAYGSLGQLREPHPYWFACLAEGHSSNDPNERLHCTVGRFCRVYAAVLIALLNQSHQYRLSSVKDPARYGGSVSVILARE